MGGFSGSIQIGKQHRAVRRNPGVKFCLGKAKVTYPDTYELRTADKYGYVNGFELAGCDGVFRYAKAEIRNNKVIVSADTVGKTPGPERRLGRRSE
jgi:hypothetical protein